MHKQIVSILVAALITLSLEAGAAAQVNVERDTRKVSDTASLDMAAISAQKDQTWVVAEVTPDATDGQFEGVKKDTKTGMYTQLPGQPVIQVHKGIFNVISPIVSMPPAQAYAYEWDLPASIYNQYLVSNSGTRDPYLAFYEKTIVVCRSKYPPPQAVGSHKAMKLLTGQAPRYPKNRIRIAPESAFGQSR